MVLCPPAPRSGQRDGGRPGRCPPPARTPSPAAVRLSTPWLVGSHLALGNGRLRWSSSSSRWSARFIAACNTHPTWSGPGCPSRRPPPRDSPHAVSGGCSRPPPSLPRPSSPCRGRMVGFCGVAPAGPRTTHGSEGSSMARGDPHPHEERRGSCPARFQSCRGHWAIWRGAQPAPGHCPENRPPHAPDPQRRPWREPREGRGPLPWTALQVPVAGGPEDGQVTRKDGGRGPRGVATPHCCPRGASTPSAQHLLQPSRGSWGQVPRGRRDLDPSHAEPPAAVAAGWRTSAAATALPEAPGPARHPPPMHFL